MADAALKDRGIQGKRFWDVPRLGVLSFAASSVFWESGSKPRGFEFELGCLLVFGVSAHPVTHVVCEDFRI